jgi:hypothetical protein
MRDLLEKALAELEHKVATEYIYPFNRPAFILARHLRGILPEDATDEQIEPYVVKFHAMADSAGLMDDPKLDDIPIYEFLPMMRPAMEKVKYPAGKELGEIVERAKERGTPPEAEGLPADDLKLLCAVCYEMHLLTGGEFFISQKTAGEILGKSQAAGYRKLLFLQSKKIISLKEKGHTGKASIYTYNRLS